LENLQQIASQASGYFQARLLINLFIAFVSGYGAVKVTGQERRSSLLLAFVVGFLGFFLAEFVLIYSGLVEYVDKLEGFRLIIDAVAAFCGAFIVAAAVHFFKPL
jgi:uncharacterized membrane protein YeaQ/YmgE (transglycosylase-associated protein family)